MSPKSMSQNVSSCNDYEQHGKMNFEFFPLLPFILQEKINHEVNKILFLVNNSSQDCTQNHCIGNAII